MKSGEGKMLSQKNLLLSLLIIFALSFLLHVNSISVINLNMFSVPETNEIYLANLNSTGFALFSSFSCECLLCNGTVAVRAGKNHLSYGECGDEVGDEVFLTCSSGGEDLILRFRRGGDPPLLDNVGLVSKIENKTLFTELSGHASRGGAAKIEYRIDGEAARSIISEFNEGAFKKKEHFSIGPGKHTVEVALNNAPLAKKEIAAGYPKFPIWLLLILISSIILVCGARVDGVVKNGLLLFGIVSFLFALQFQLQSLGVGEHALPVASALLALVVWIKKKPKSPLRRLKVKKEDISSIAFGMGVVLIVLMLWTATKGTDGWAPYYRRHAEEVNKRGTVFYDDELSYLGRGFTYPVAYFEFAASLTKLLMAWSFEDIFFWQHFLIVFLFGLSIYAMLEKYRGNGRFLAALIIISETFLITTATNVTLHIFAYTLLNISALFLSTWFLSGVFLATAFSAHPSALFLFPFYVLVAGQFSIRKETIKNTILACALGVLLSLPFYVPIFLSHGIPYEIVPERWGYLLTFGTDSILFDFHTMVPLLVLVVAAGLVKEKTRMPAVLLLVAAASVIFVSYRANMIAAVLLGGLTPIVFGKWLNKKKVFLALCLFPLASLLFFFPLFYSGPREWCLFGVLNEKCTLPMRYVSTYTSTSDRVVINPMFGHTEACFGGRPILADLYVEYADEEKFKEATAFWEDGRKPNKKYGITVYILDDLYEERDMPGADRIYDNGFMHVYRE